MSEERFDRIEKRFDGLDTRLTRVEILQEEMNDRIQLVAEGHAAVLAAIAQSEQAVKAHIDARIDPLELALRAHLGT